MALKNNVHERHHRIRPKLGKRNSWIQLWNTLVPVYFVINYHDFEVVSLYNHSKILQETHSKKSSGQRNFGKFGKGIRLGPWMWHLSFDY